MESITSWMRLEPWSRSAEMKDSLQARIYDPLWLLARQWQLGEFQGEDNGSPVFGRWRAVSGPITRYFPGTVKPPQTMVNAPRYDSSRMPLETVVEREKVLPFATQSQPDKLRLTAEAGLHFLRVLEEQALSLDYRAAFVRQYPFPLLTEEERETLDGASLRFVDLMASRVPDGQQLYAAFRSSGGSSIVFEPALHIAPPDLEKVTGAAKLWLQWFETLFSEPDSSTSWDPERLEYSFSVAASLSDSEVTLTAQEYFEGHLDWYSFDVNADLSLGGEADAELLDVTRTAIPAPATFRGMPAARFWEFEDAQVDFGSVDAGPTDLGRMLLVEFALTYGNDWFVIPVELDIGFVYRTMSLVITDTFGVQTLIKPSSLLSEPYSAWRMFEHSYLRGSTNNGAASNLFVLTPSLAKSQESQPVEEVLFLRDEMANMAWGVERIVESAAENALNRFASRPQVIQPASEQSPGGNLNYKLATEVPDNWVPLIPVKSNEGLRLQRGKVYTGDGHGPAQFVEAKGRILNPNGINETGLRIFEEEIPREGVRVTRNYQLTRWHDGSTHLWVGRRKKVGTGEGSSGLRFDILESKEI